MEPNKIDLHCQHATPQHTKAVQGDEVEFFNKTGAKVTVVFDDGDIFDPPQGPRFKLTLDYRDSACLTIGDISCGSRFRYPNCSRFFKFLAPRTGRIDP